MDRVKGFQDITLMHIRSVLFLSALILYAIFGIPTPDSPGIWEAIIGTALVLSIGIAAAASLLRVAPHQPLYVSAGQLLLIYGLTVPLLGAAVEGHDIKHIARDLIPFLFLLLPVFFSHHLQENPKFYRHCLAGVLVIGLCFSVRALMETHYDFFGLASFWRPSEEQTYLANAPTLLFTSLYIFGMGAVLFIQKPSFFRWGIAIFALLAALLILVPVGLTLQRASLAYVSFFVLVLGAIAFYKAPVRTIVFLTSILVLLLPLWPQLFDLATQLFQKTNLVGLNARAEEWSAVWTHVSASGIRVLFGVGWGSGFDSPAVGGVYVYFTHSLLSSSLLKMGIIGVILVILYLFGIAQILWRILPGNPFLALALAGPIVIDVLLYASYKSLDFGLILLLVCAYGASREKIAKARPLVYSKSHSNCKTNLISPFVS